MRLAILGRQPEISLAELESIFGANAVQPVSSIAAVIDTQNPLPQDRLGGTMKSGIIIDTTSTTDIPQIFDYLQQNIAKLLTDKPTGKLKLGFSLYGFDYKPAKLLPYTLKLKKSIKASGRSVRIIENKHLELSSAQVLYNKLTHELGLEILIIKNGNKTIVARTEAVQDIDAYAERDFGRPRRDARVGMLPPKLAQIIINLAGAEPSSCILDPFCGTGVILQEASLMGYSVHGSDIKPRMVEYSEQNLEWLGQKYQMANGKWQIEAADATDHTWNPTPDAIACETYLGRPFSAPPKLEILQKVMQDVDTIHHKFLQNVARQTPSGFRMCIAVPAWRVANGFKHLKVLDSLDDLGYTRQVFKHAGADELIYHRPEQIVARELVILIRK